MSEVAKTQSSAEPDRPNDYKNALKDVIRKQLRELLQQLEANGEEVAVFAVDVGDFSGTQMGTTKGEAFMEHQTDLMPLFMDFCKNGPKDDTGTFQERDPSPEVNISCRRKTSRRKAYSKKPPGKGNAAKQTTVASENLSDVLRVEIPRQFTTGITDNEVASLLGHLVGAQLVTNKLKGDSAGSTFKFNTLLELANRANRKDKQPTEKLNPSPVKEPSTPSSTRSGRRVSSKFLESINSLKKQSRIRQEVSDDEPSEQETSLEGKDLIEELKSIDPLIIKRIHIKSATGKLVDATFTELTSSPEIESLAKNLLQEMDKLQKNHPIFNFKYVKVMIISDEHIEKDSGSEEGESISIKIIQCDWNVGAKKSARDKDKIPSTQPALDEMNLEEVDKAEESELQKDLGELSKDIDAINNESTDIKVTVNLTEHKAKKIKVGTASNISPAGLVRKPKGRHYTETMPVECPHCGVSLTGRSNLKSHIKRVHMKIKNHFCTICAKPFWSSHALESHMLSVHTRQCESCQEYVVESVPWSEGLNMKTRRDVICSCGSIVSICSTFGRKRMYLYDYEPDEQGNVFVKRPKNNAGTKYACGTCGKLFLKKSNCERHSRKHTDVRKCVCHICGTGYIYESSLKKHLQTEHGIMKHVCDICGGNYASLTALKVHIVKTHNDVKIDLGDADVEMNEEHLEDIKDIDKLDEEMEEAEVEEERQNEGTPEIIINGSSGEIIVQHKGQEIYEQIQTSHIDSIATTESIVVTETVGDGEQIIVAKSEDLVAGEEHIVFDQGGHIVVTSEDTSQAAQLVQQVIGGQIIEQDGNMSIIIKQVPVENEMY